MALDFAGDDIRVNIVCPGPIESELLRSNLGDELTRENIQQRSAQKRIGDVEEVAAAVLFLASEEASLITGVALAVDGGRAFH